MKEWYITGYVSAALTLIVCSSMGYFWIHYRAGWFGYAFGVFCILYGVGIATLYIVTIGRSGWWTK